jgi:hypothetical protein
MNAQIALVRQFAPDFRDPERNKDACNFRIAFRYGNEWYSSTATVAEQSLPLAYAWLLEADPVVNPGGNVGARFMDRWHARVARDHDLVMPYIDFDSPSGEVFDEQVLRALIKRCCELLTEYLGVRIMRDKQKMLATVVTRNTRKSAFSAHVYWYRIRVPRKELYNLMRKVQDAIQPLALVKRIKLDLGPYALISLRLPFSWGFKPKEPEYVGGQHLVYNLYYASGEPIERSSQLEKFCPWHGIEDPYSRAIKIIETLDLTNCNTVYFECSMAHSKRSHLEAALDAPPPPKQLLPVVNSARVISMFDSSIYYDPSAIARDVQALVDKYCLKHPEVIEYFNERFVLIDPTSIGAKMMFAHNFVDVDQDPVNAFRLSLVVYKRAHFTRNSVVTVTVNEYNVRTKQTEPKEYNMFDVWSRHVDAFRVSEPVFLPRGPLAPMKNSRIGTTAINTWQGFVGYHYDLESIDRNELLTDPTQPLSIIINFVHRVLCNNMLRLSMFQFVCLKRIFEHPDMSVERFILILGPQGIGKSTYLSFLNTAVFGTIHSILECNSARLGAKFNSLLEQVSTVFLDEASVGESLWTLMKGYITGQSMTIEHKGVDILAQRTAPIQIFGASNSEDLHFTEKERRLVLIQTNPDVKTDTDHDEIERFRCACLDPRAGPQFTYFLTKMLSDDMYTEERPHFFIGRTYNSIRAKSFTGPLQWYYDAIVNASNASKAPDQPLGAPANCDVDHPHWFLRIPQRDLLDDIKRSIGSARLGSESVFSVLKQFGCTIDGGKVMFLPYKDAVTRFAKVKEFNAAVDDKVEFKHTEFDNKLDWVEAYGIKDVAVAPVPAPEPAKIIAPDDGGHAIDAGLAALAMNSPVRNDDDVDQAWLDAAVERDEEKAERLRRIREAEEEAERAFRQDAEMIDSYDSDSD